MDLRNGFDIKRYIRTIPDYPKPGILFRDITTLLANLHAFRASIDELDDIAGRLARSANQLGGSWRDVASSLRLTEDAARRAYDRPRAS